MFSDGILEISQNPFRIQTLNLNHSALRACLPGDLDNLTDMTDCQRMSNDELSLIVTDSAVKSCGSDVGKPYFSNR